MDNYRMNRFYIARLLLTHQKSGYFYVLVYLIYTNGTEKNSEENSMEFFNNTVTVFQILVITLSTSFSTWGAINLLIRIRQ